MQIHAQRNKCGREELNKARIADQMRKLALQLGTDVLGVKGFERAIVTLMEQNQDGHNLRECQVASAIAPLGVADQALLVPPGFKRPTKVIDMAEEFEYTHG
jgi:hypothetical protein